MLISIAITVDWENSSLHSMAVLVGGAKQKRRAGAGNGEQIGTGASPLFRACFARVFAALPLSRAPVKTAMLHRLGDWTHS